MHARTHTQAHTHTFRFKKKEVEQRIFLVFQVLRDEICSARFGLIRPQPATKEQRENRNGCKIGCVVKSLSFFSTTFLQVQFHSGVPWTIRFVRIFDRQKMK